MGMNTIMDQLRDMAHNMSALAADAIEYIEFHTGLPAIVLFTVIALILGAYYLISSILAPSQIGAAPPASLSAMVDEEVDQATEAAAAAAENPASTDLGEDISLSELSKYDGKDSSKPLLIAVKGTIYDVSSAREFYGPGGLYAAFAGRDASRALSKMSFDDSDLCGDLSGLSSDQLEVLSDWETKFASKYRKAGTIKHKKDDKVDRSMIDDAAIAMELQSHKDKEKKSEKQDGDEGSPEKKKDGNEERDKGGEKLVSKEKEGEEKREQESENETTVTSELGHRDRHGGSEDSFNSSSAA